MQVGFVFLRYCKPFSDTGRSYVTIRWTVLLESVKVNEKMNLNVKLWYFFIYFFLLISGWLSLK